MPLPKEELYTIGDIYSLPEGERAELIDGQIYDMAPPSRHHQEISMELSTAIQSYIRSKKETAEFMPLLLPCSWTRTPILMWSLIFP